MDNVLFFGDLHISKDSLKECNLILKEILFLCDKYNITKVINLGDTFDRINPSSEELDLFASFIKKLNREIIILAAKSHESTAPEESILNHFGILFEKIQIVKEYIDENYLYCGHFTLNESMKYYGSKRSKNEFKNYKYVLLGHQHQPQVIKPNICHLGSTRYVNFDEINDKKQVLLIENYRLEEEKCHFIALQSHYPMKVVSISTLTKNASQAQSGERFPEEAIAYLDSLDQKTKVKVIVKDFVAYKKWLSLSNTKSYDKKFIKFVIENDFQLVNSVLTPIKTKDETNLKESFEKFIKEKSIDNEIKVIIEKELND